MQTSQRNSASDLLMSEPKPDSTITRIFPSPFSASIQAAKKYLERQRADPSQSPTGGESSRREHGSSDQNRRLERNLYEGHSTEPGLNFEGASAGDSENASDEERAYLADSDGTEPLFAYASSGPLPDPEIIRGAISRLARESESHRRVAAAGPLQSPDFGEVARRVWGSDAAPVRVGAPVVSEHDWESRTMGNTVVNGSLSRDLDEGGVQGDVGRHASPLSSGSKATQVEQGEFANHPTALTASGTFSGTEINRDIALTSESPEASPVPGCDVEAEPALAHDACNLLSALALYSELLEMPGVLSEKHQRYAEDMRLLANRSHILIDRLLHVAALRTAQPSKFDVEPHPWSEPIAPIEHEAAFFQPLSQAAEGPLRTEVVRGPVSEPAQEDRILESSGGDMAESHLSMASTTKINGQTGGTNLVDLLMRWGSLLSTLAHGTLEVVFGPNAAAPIHVEAEALERILVNLVRNARAATVQGGAIRISAGIVDGDAEEALSRTLPNTTAEVVVVGSKNGSFGSDKAHTMVLTVDDSGCGMTDTQIQCLLDGDDGGHLPQIVPLSGESPRRGLGVLIVRELVAASGGSFSIQSAIGRGTRIEIRWTVIASDLSRTPVEEARSRSTEEHAGEDRDAASPLEASTLMPVIATETARNVLGPDGFSETELRGMMLRLHRGGTPERSPLGRRMGNRTIGIRGIARGFGSTTSSTGSPETSFFEQDDPSQKEAASKGAIAC